jgi:hypothetical protein
MITRDIYVPDGTMKSTSKKNKEHDPDAMEILFLVR